MCPNITGLQFGTNFFTAFVAWLINLLTLSIGIDTSCFIDPPSRF